MEKYANALAEVDTILDYLVEEDYNKIPEDVIEIIKENKNEDYIFEYNEDTELKEQELLTETRAILYNLFRDYLSTPEQKEKIRKWQQEDRVKAEQKKLENYEYKDLFRQNKNDINDSQNTVQNTQENQMIEEKLNNVTELIVIQEKWYQKLFREIRSFWKKKLW